MTDADTARGIVATNPHECDPCGRLMPNPLLVEAIADALTEARTAGFNEAKERAVGIANSMGGYADRGTSYANGARWAGGTIATALQAMKQGGNDD